MEPVPSGLGDEVAALVVVVLKVLPDKEFSVVDCTKAPGGIVGFSDGKTTELDEDREDEVCTLSVDANVVASSAFSSVKVVRG